MRFEKEHEAFVILYGCYGEDFKIHEEDFYDEDDACRRYKQLTESEQWGYVHLLTRFRNVKVIE